uniref:Uncharacterized protein n=2 Tax=viral metagenome TaxID=1070528 RepID=A0A6H2A309_9ZZZZ
MKILKISTAGVAGIFFPIGRPSRGGTCEHSSDICQEKCYALDKDYDETMNITESEKKEIYKYFIEQTVFQVCNEIIKEMGELQTKILSWFVSGDCLDKDIDKICRIMKVLTEECVIQNGFTRNKELYDKVQSENIMKHLILTVESKNAEDAPYDAHDYPKGLWAIPDYDSGVVKLYLGKWGSKTEQGSCGFNEVTGNFEGKEITIASNCLGCYNKGIGCFS